MTDQTMHVEPDFFPPGARVAFLYLPTPGWKEAAQRFFESQGFAIATAASAEEAVAKLRLNSYEVLLLEDSPDGAKVLTELATLPGTVRQAMNVLLTGSEGGSLDPRTAFLKSVNAYLAAGDHSKAAQLLPQAMATYQEHYQSLLRAKADLGV